MSRRPQHSRQTSRLPPIAPRDGPPPPPAAVAETASTSEGSIRPPRARLPPRSRSGCWTCRTRKVKCDEGRPRCNQCTRLGHVCDYNPRLAFKDETSKIVEKYLGGGGPTRQWDTSQKLSQDAQALRETDTLPPFSTLTTEEDWEKKAGHRAPGTYYVIANSTSFPPSGDSTPGVSAPRSPMTPSHSRRQSLYSGSADAAPDDVLARRAANVVLDEDTLILGSVEETTRQSQSFGGASALLLQLDQGRISPGSPIPFTFLPGQGDLGISTPLGLPYPAGRYTQQDLRRRHYRTVVRKHMFSTNGHEDSPYLDRSDLFEQEAENFPLLAAALDELSAWSLAANGGVQNFDTQERYLEILASLRKQDAEADLKRNGRYLTHALLLVYEISASHRSWPLHLAALLHILQIRGKELSIQYPGLLQTIMFIDCNALLCGSGNGKLTDFVLDNDLLPSSKDWVEKGVPVGMMTPQTRPDLDLTLKATRYLEDLFDHSRRLGKLTNVFREQFADLGSHSPSVRTAQIGRWQHETIAVRMSLEQTWQSFYPDMMLVFQDTSAVDETVATACETCWFFYHILMLYSFTSMWPTQRLEKIPVNEENIIAQLCTTILERCEGLLIRGEFSRRILVFPLFLAGFVSQDLGEKRHALDLLHLMEQASIGNNTRATRRWLQRLYGEQATAQESGMPFAVDWVSKIKEQDFCIVHCGY